mgnify:CR=1 FL=1
MARSTITLSPGDRVHALTVVETDLRKPPSPSRARAGAKSEAAVRVVCDCGNSLLIRPFEFAKGMWRSCGCQNRKASSARASSRNTTHGLSDHPSYGRWKAMIGRCTDPADPDFDRYGGRGITVFPEWVADPKAFLAYLDSELGPCPEGHTMDRTDNALGYQPGNLRWADAPTQRQNQDRYTTGGA